MSEKHALGRETIRICLLGCGSMGTAVIQGWLKQNSIKVKSIEVTVASPSSVDKAREALGDAVKIYKGDNVAVARSADAVILACPPPAMKPVLTEDGMRDALKGKPLISLLAGITTSAMAETLGRPASSGIFRALPNLAIASCASATALEIPPPETPKEMIDFVDDLFSSLGGVTHVPAALMNAGTVLCGSTPAFVALFLDGMIDGAIAAGVPREKANSMTAQMLRSTAALLESQTPSSLRESVCAMPGCTIQGNIILEEGCVRGNAAKAVKSSIEAASKLG